MSGICNSKTLTKCDEVAIAVVSLRNPRTTKLNSERVHCPECRIGQAISCKGVDRSGRVIDIAGVNRTTHYINHTLSSCVWCRLVPHAHEVRHKNVPCQDGIDRIQAVVEVLLPGL